MEMIIAIIRSVVFLEGVSSECTYAEYVDELVWYFIIVFFKQLQLKQ